MIVVDPSQYSPTINQLDGFGRSAKPIPGFRSADSLSQSHPVRQWLSETWEFATLGAAEGAVRPRRHRAPGYQRYTLASSQLVTASSTTATISMTSTVFASPVE
jgi:hypothetical protein